MGLGGTNILGLVLELTDNATPRLRSFGSSLSLAGRQVDSFASGFSNMESKVNKSLSNIRSTTEELRSVMNKPMPDPVANWAPADRVNSALNQAQFRYEAFQQNLQRISQKYQSGVMGAVALSMTGVGLQNYSRPILEGWAKMTKAAMDYQQSLVKIQLTTANFGNLHGQNLANANAQISKSIMAAGIASPLSNAQMADMAQTIATMGYHKSGQLNSMIAPSMLLQAISQKSNGSFELDQNQAAQLVSSLVLQSGQGLGKLTNTKLAGQKFSGVSSNAMSIVSQMTKAAHDAHLTYADIQSYVNSSGASMSKSGMSLADFLTMGGAMKKSGLNSRRAGMDTQGLVTVLSKFQSNIDMGKVKPGSDAWWAQKLGFTMGNVGKNGDFLNNLLQVVDNAKKHGQGGILNKLANTTGSNVISALMQLQDQYGRHVSGVDKNAQMIAKDIAGAGKKDYAKQRMDALAKTPQYQWQQFLGTLQSIAQTIGMTLLPGINKFLNVVNDLSGKLLTFTEEHPKLAAMLGWGMGLTGLLGMAAGKLLTFAGNIAAAKYSLANYRIQLIASRAEQSMFNEGMVTGNEVLAGTGGFLGGVKKAMIQLGFFGLLAGGVFAAWKMNLGGLKDMITDFGNKAVKAWHNISQAISDYQSGNVKNFNQDAQNIQKSGANWYTFSKFLVDVALVFSAFVQSWNTNKLSVDQFKMLKKEGLLPTLEKLLNLKYEATTFFDGFAKGFKTFTSTLGAILSPFKPLWNWFVNSMGFGDMKGGGKAGHNFEAVGQKIGQVAGVITAALIGIRIYAKLARLALSGVGTGIKLSKGIFGVGKGIFNFLRHPIQGIKGMAGNELTRAIEENKGILYRTLGPDIFKIYEELRNAIGRGIRDGVREGGGENPMDYYGGLGGGSGGSEGEGGSGRRRGGIRNFVRSRFTRAGRSDRRWNAITNGMSESESHEVRTLFNSNSALDRAEAMRRIDTHRGLNRSIMSEHELNSAGYHATYDRATGRRRNWSRVTRNQRILEAARGLHSQGRLGTSQAELEDMFNSHNGSAAHHISRLQTRDYLQDAEGMSEHDLYTGARSMEREARGEARMARMTGFMNTSRTGRMLGRMGRMGRGIGRVGGFLGRGMGRFAMGAGGKMLGGAGVALGLLSMFPDVAEASGFGGKVDAVGAGLGIKKKGGGNSAFSGAMAGAGIGMMFGPVGALVGAGIGGVLGAVGTDKIKKFGATLVKVGKSSWDKVARAGKNIWHGISSTASSAWNTTKKDANVFWNTTKKDANVFWQATKSAGSAMWSGMKTTGSATWSFIKSDFSSKWSLITGIANALWTGFKGIATNTFRAIKDIATGNWGDIGKALNAIWDSFKTAAVNAWNSVKKFIADNPIVQGVKQVGSSIVSGAKKLLGLDGSHAGGLTRVPFDGYVAELHKDERVLTAQEAEKFRRNSRSSDSSVGGGMSVNFDKGAIVIQMANASQAEISRAADQLFREFMKKIENKNIVNHKPSRMRGQLT